MNKSRFFPLLGLSILSVLITISAVIAVWNQATDAVTVSERIRSSLGLGISAGVGLSIVLWVSAGVENWLAHIQKKSTKIVVYLSVYLFVPLFICVILPGGLILLLSGSLFPQKGWQDLPYPPSPAVEITSVGDASVSVKAEDGFYYYCWTLHPENCWDKITKPDDFIAQNSSSGFPEETVVEPSRKAPKGYVDLHGVKYSDMGNEAYAYYAVLEDGSVMYLEQGAEKNERGFTAGLMFVFTIIPALAGLIAIYVGAGIGALLRWLGGLFSEKEPTLG